MSKRVPCEKILNMSIPPYPCPTIHCCYIIKTSLAQELIEYNLSMNIALKQWPHTYHGVGNNKGYPANKQESAQEHGGKVLQDGINCSLWSGCSLAGCLGSILWDRVRQILPGTASHINCLRSKNCINLNDPLSAMTA